MRWLLVRLSCALVMAFVLPQLANAVEPLGISVSEDQVYIYWGPLKDSDGSYELQRAKGNGKFKKLIQIRRISDVDEANRVLRSAPDALSRALTLDSGFEQRAADKPEVDQGMALASVGYAILRGYGYLDSDVSRRQQYKYRLVQLATNGTVNVIAEGEADTARFSQPEAVVFIGEVDDNHPVLKWKSVPYVRYHIQRADKPEGPYTRLTLMPLPSSNTNQMMRYDDTRVKPDGRRYFYQVVAYSMLDQQGVIADPIAISTPDLTAPAPPAQLDSDSEPATAVLNWKAGKETDLAGYHIYRREVLKDVDADGKHKVGEEKRLTRTLLGVDMVRFRDGDVIPGQIYQYEMTASDTSGNESVHSLPVLAVPRDITRPQRPTGLSAAIGDNSKVKLTWNANNDADLYAYRIYRSADESDLTFVRELPVSELQNQASPSHTEKLDTHSESEYRYAVAAVDGTENESTLSDTVNVKLPDIVPPSQPVLTELKAENGAIKLAWAPSPSADVNGYNVYRAEADSKISRINAAPFAANVLMYRDGTVKAGIVYRYAVSAIDHSGNEGDLSDERSSVTYAAIDPVAPSALSLDKSSKPWRLLWQGSAKASGFIAYLASARDGDYHQVGAMLTKPSLDVPVPAGSTYWYRIQAVFPGGVVSAMSVPIAVMPPAKEKQ